jgi:hypothetical protein
MHNCRSYRNTIDLEYDKNWRDKRSDCRMEEGLVGMGCIWIPTSICSIHGYMRNRRKSRNTNEMGCGTSWRDMCSDCNRRKTFVFPKRYDRQVAGTGEFCV